MNKFFTENKKTITEEFIKSVFTLIIAVIAVMFWENQKIRSSISFEKKMDIITQERSQLMENADRFTESWNYISQYTKENGIKDCLTMSTYATRYNMLQRIGDKTDLILGNNLIHSDKLKELHNRFALENDTLLSDMYNCKLNKNKYDSIATIFDQITMLYSREITKQLK